MTVVKRLTVSLAGLLYSFFFFYFFDRERSIWKNTFQTKKWRRPPSKEMEGATAPLAARSLHSFAACLCAATPFEKTKTNKQANKEVPHRDYFTHVSVFFFPQTRQFSHCLYYYYYYVTPFFLPLLWGGDFFTSFLSPFSTLLVSLVFFFSFFFYCSRRKNGCAWLRQKQLRIRLT